MAILHTRVYVFPFLATNRTSPKPNKPSTVVSVQCTSTNAVVVGSCALEHTFKTSQYSLPLTLIENKKK
jgi:hypothetical protein